MKPIYRLNLFFSDHLPRKPHPTKFPVLYAKNDKYILELYAYDYEKKIIYCKKLGGFTPFYISLFEYNYHHYKVFNNLADFEFELEKRNIKIPEMPRNFPF